METYSEHNDSPFAHIVFFEPFFDILLIKLEPLNYTLHLSPNILRLGRDIPAIVRPVLGLDRVYAVKHLLFKGVIAFAHVRDICTFVIIQEQLHFFVKSKHIS